MVVAGSRKHIYFMGERGLNLERIPSRVNNTGTRIEPWTFPGADFQDIVREALYFTEKSPFDLIFLCAGIYNIVNKDEPTGKFFFPWSSCEQLILALLKMVDKADKHFCKDRPATKVIYCPVIGADLGRLLGRDAAQQQLILNEGVWALNQKFYGLNKARSYYCPNMVVPVHRIVSGKRKNCYHHLG